LLGKAIRSMVEVGAGIDGNCLNAVTVQIKNDGGRDSCGLVEFLLDVCDSGGFIPVDYSIDKVKYISPW